MHVDLLQRIKWCHGILLGYGSWAFDVVNGNLAHNADHYFHPLFCFSLFIRLTWGQD